MSLFYSGGMCLNDLCDAEVDRTYKPFRPIPSNRIPVQSARFFTVLLFGLALAQLLLVPFPKAFYAGFLLLLIIIVYDEIHKKNSIGVLLMAGCRLLIFVVSAIAVTGTVGINVWGAGLLQFVYILILSLAARHENALAKGFAFPGVPWMLAWISLLDGIVMAVFVSPFWLIAGLIGMGLTRLSQEYIRGD